MKTTITINENDNLLSLREIKPKKITRATIKSFIKKNKDNLYIKTKDKFNGMIDMVDDCQDQTIRKVTLTDDHNDYNFGIKGAWFVGSSRDYFNSAEFGQFKGYEVYNCVGTFYLLIKEEKNLEQTIKDKLIKDGISKDWMDKHLIIDMPTKEVK